jgi:hypothetical protein
VGEGEAWVEACHRSWSAALRLTTPVCSWDRVEGRPQFQSEGFRLLAVDFLRKRWDMTSSK